MLTLGRGLARTHQVILAFPEEAVGFAASSHGAGLEARTFAAAEESALLDALRPDVLHVHAGIGWEGHALVAAGAAVGARVVRTEHLPWLITEPGQEADYAAGIVAVDAFIAVSAAAAATWAPVLARLRPGARLTAIRNGIEPPEVTRSRAETRATLGIAVGAPLLLCVGRFTLQKDQRSLVRAVRLLQARGVHAWLLLVGDGPERAGCEAEAEGCERIRFLGTRGDVGDLMRAADLLVLPSRFEGLPLVVLEAMALGLPVVASRIDSAVEALGAGHPGFAAPGDAESLASAIAAALATPAEGVAAAQQRALRDEFHRRAHDHRDGVALPLGHARRPPAQRERTWKV